MTKIVPTKKVSRFEKYNCTGKLRVEVKKDAGEITELILLPKKGGCRILLQLIGRLITCMLECNVSLDYIKSILRDTDPCTAPKERMDRAEIPKEELGFGGCPKIILQAIEAKEKETK